jgi:hypothetical protein
MIPIKSANQVISYFNKYRRKPASLSELIEVAMEEHLKYHSTDGMSLFILMVYAADGNTYVKRQSRTVQERGRKKCFTNRTNQQRRIAQLLSRCQRA